MCNFSIWVGVGHLEVIYPVAMVGFRLTALPRPTLLQPACAGSAITVATPTATAGDACKACYVLALCGSRSECDENTIGDTVYVSTVIHQHDPGNRMA